MSLKKCQLQSIDAVFIVVSTGSATREIIVHFEWITFGPTRGTVTALWNRLRNGQNKGVEVSRTCSTPDGGVHRKCYSEKVEIDLRMSA
jgi:hypothetical protein